MAKESFFERITELTGKFKSFFQHRKQIKAIENFASCDKFYHSPYLKLIKCCMEEGFLGEEEAVFLGHMLRKYEINHLDWAHKTKWLKKEIQQKSDKQKKLTPIQTFFEFESSDVPVEIMNQQQAHAQRMNA